MPITRQQFELGIDSEIETYMRNVATFLEHHPDEAYSLDELWQSVIGEPASVPFSAISIWPLEQKKFAYALDRLVDLGVAADRQLANVRYYSIGRVKLAQVLTP